MSEEFVRNITVEAASPDEAMEEAKRKLKSAFEAEGYTVVEIHVEGIKEVA